MSDSYFICCQNVVLGDEIKPAAIEVRDGKIANISSIDAICKQSGSVVIDYGNLTLMPGLVDTHVHVNEPGRTIWEGFWSATRAAAAGGVTTIVDMPLNSSPVTTSVAALESKLESMKNKLWVDVALLGGIVPGNASELIAMVERGVVGFKCFMIHSGIDDFPMVTENDIAKALEVLKTLDDPVVYMFHAEVPDPIELYAQSEEAKKDDPTLYHSFLKTRPKEAEDRAIEQIISLCETAGSNKVPCHIVHLSSSESPKLQDAKKKGVNISAETTFHYLCLTAEEVPKGNTLFKCCPPIRESSNRDKLWEALRNGIITQVISDHSPCTVDLKKLDTGNFNEAWGGIASLQLGLSVMWTEAKKRGFNITDLVKWMSVETAKLVNLYDKKGSIEVGKDADFVIWDPLASFKIISDSLHMRNKCTPYADKEVHGVVIATYLRGQKIYENGSFSDQPLGQHLTNSKCGEYSFTC